MPDCVPATSLLRVNEGTYVFQGQSDLVFDGFVFLFRRRDLSHETSRGDKILSPRKVVLTKMGS